jgi:hypothetical protein
MWVEQALDRVLPTFTQQTQARSYKRQLFLMEDLNSEFYAIAKRDKSIEAAHLCARLNERICAMNGWTSVNIRMDPVAAQAAEMPTQHEQIKDAIMRVARGPNWRELVDERLNDLPASGNGNGGSGPEEPTR